MIDDEPEQTEGFTVRFSLWTLGKCSFSGNDFCHLLK